MKKLVFITTLCLSFSALAAIPNHSAAINAAFEVALHTNCQTYRQGVKTYSTTCAHKNFEAGFEVSIENNAIEGTGTFKVSENPSVPYGFCNVKGSLQATDRANIETSCFSGQD